MARSTDWSLKKVFVREKLDLSAHTGELFCYGKHNLRVLLGNLALNLRKSLERLKWQSFEACITSATFGKITAAQLQLSCEQPQNIDAVLDVIATLFKTRDNVWVYR